MFLVENENLKQNAINESMYTGDAYEGLQIVLESEQAWNELTMKMIRLEHTAIITEDSALLEAGKENFGQKVVEFFKRVYQKIQDFVNSAIASISASIAKMSKVSQVKFVAGKKITLPKDVQAFLNNVKEAKSALAGVNAGEEVQRDKEQVEVEISAALYQTAKQVLDSRKQYISILKQSLADAKKEANAGIAEAKKAEGGKDAAKIQEHKTTLLDIQTKTANAIRYINKGTVYSIKILSAMKPGKAPKADGKAAEKAPETEAKTESVDILDMFA